MHKLKTLTPTIARYLMGLIFFLSGAAGLFNLVPPPTDLPPNLQTYFTGLMAAVYFMPLLKATEMICGLLLLVGYAPALALVILAPITVNIFFVHAFLTPGVKELILPVVMVILHVFAATAYWRVYRPLFGR